MKKSIRKISVFFGMLLIGALVLSEAGLLKTKAATSLFTLGVIPVVNHEVAGTNAVNVSNITQYIDAVNNPAVDVINFTTNITAATMGQAMGLSVNRDLLINGNGFTLTITGNSNFGPNNGGTGIPNGTHLMLGGTGGTFHLKNLTLNRGTTGGGQNDVISVMTGTNQTWDIIFDNFTCIYEVNQWNSVIRVATGTLNSTRIFLRNNSNLRLPSSGSVFVTNGSVVSEENSTVNVTARANAAIFGIPGSDTRFYVSPGSNTTLGLPPQTNMGNRGVLASVREINVYPTATLDLTGAGTASVSTLTSVNSTTEMVLRVDHDASLKVENTAGPAIISTGTYPVRILGNPGSTVEIFGTGTVTSAQMTAANSEIALSSPKYYNIQNNGTGLAFSGIGASTPTLKLTETNVGAWLRGQSVAGNPQTPSPFANVDLFTGSGTALAGSSSSVNTMAGGWNTSNYNRIAYANVVEITAEDVTVGVGRNQDINPQVIPSDATLAYASNNTSVATVDINGTVTGVGVGTTTITISGTSAAGFYPGITTINVTVTNNPPVLEVPAFTEVPLNGIFDPKAGVTATDVEDGDLIESVQVLNTVDTKVPGIQIVNYSLRDFNNNTVTGKQVVLIQDTNFVVGTNTILHATDFTKRPTQVDTAVSAIKTAASVKVYNKATGAELMNEPVTITEDSGYSAIVNTYPITFQVDQETSTTITIDANVVTGEFPVLTVNPAFVQVSLDGTFNEVTGVTATDAEDGTIPVDNIAIDNPVDTAVAGVYVVTYTVTDLDGNSASKTRTVLVQDDKFVVGNSTIITANDFTKRPTQVDTAAAAIKVAAGVKVYDKATGVELVNEPVTITEDSGYSAVVGTYPITFEVDKDMAATTTIDGKVITGAIPVVTVDPAFVEVVLNGVFDATAGVTATDLEDGAIATEEITVSDTVDTSETGVYVVTYSVIDSDGNTGTATRIVLINDGTFTTGATHMIQSQNFTKRISQVDTSDGAIKTAASVKVYNKSTGLEDTVTGVTITDKDGYGKAVGAYTITFQVNGDTAAQSSMVASVIAGQPPVLSVPAFTEVVLNGSFYPETGVTAIDPEEGNIIGDVVIDGSVDTSVAGLYILDYQVTDLDGNSDTATQVVLVNDGTYKTGDTYILHGEDFEKTLGQVDTAPTAIKSAANVSVYSKATGVENNTTTVNVKEDGGYTQALGSYNITFEIAEDTVAQVTIVGKVITGELPVLTVPSFTEISVGDSFDPTTDVTATDPEDGNLILSPGFVVLNTVDVNEAGVYTVKYSLTDSDSNTVTAEQVVLVNDGNYSAGASNILFAKDFTNRIGQVDTSVTAIKADAEAKIYSKVTGVFIASATINVVDKGGYDAVEGTYNIVLEIGGDTATRTVKAEVLPGVPPTVTVPAFTEISQGGSFNPTEGVSATDDEDGDFLIGEITITGSVDVNTPNVYRVTYSVTDSDGNTATDTQVVLVNDGTFKAGTNTILHATDFTKRPSQVDTAPAAIKTAAGVKVYNKATGLELVNEPVTITEDSGYSATVDTYPITIEVDQETSTTLTIDAHVVTGEFPVLTVNPTFVEVPLNGVFNEKAGVTATDMEDGLITSKVAVDSPVDTAVAGMYTVTYTITDTDGNQASKTRTVLVQDNNFVVGNSTIIKASDFTKRPSEVDTTPSAIKVAAGVKVYDKVTGLELVNEPTTITEDSGYSSVVETYPITFAVDQDTAATITIDANVVTGEFPVLTVDPTFKEVPLNGTFSVLNGVTAIDAEDGIITEDMDIDNPVDTSVAGVYTITYTSTDLDGNSVSKTRTILVQDNSFVVGTDTIIQANDFVKRPSEVDTTPGVIKAAAGVNVYDKATGEELANEPVVITQDSGYGAAINIYAITFKVVRDGTAIITIDAHVVTGEAPVLTVPDLTEVLLNGSFDPRTNISATDVEDGPLTGRIEIEEDTVNTTVVGIYHVMYSVTDDDGNRVEATQRVVVNDGSMTVGDTTILSATDFQKRVGQVDTNAGAIRTAANVKVYARTTGLEIPGAIVNIVDLGNYHGAVGTYPITFEVSGDSQTRKTINAEVITGDSPILMVPPFRETTVNSNFDLLTGVTATDTEDVIITEVSIVGEFDNAIQGVYTLQYSVVDSDGNRASAEGVILVDNGEFNVGDTTIIQARDFVKRIGEVDVSDAAVIEAANVKLYDKVTGKEMENPQITVNDIGGYQGIAGDYTITFSATNDPAATQSIIGTVISGEFPVIDAPTFTEVNVGGSFDPMADVTVTDDEDTDIADHLNITEAVDTSKPGVYTVHYEVTDTDGNRTEALQVVLVQNGKFSVGDSNILYAENFEKRVSQVDLSETAILAAAKVRVFDKMTGEELTVADVTIGDLGGYQAAPGTYNIQFEAINDASTNITIQAIVAQGTPPVLTVPELTEVPLNGSFDAMTGVTATDDEDGDITRFVQVSGTVNVNTVGIYTLNYSITDKDGNTVTAQQIVLVSDGELIVGERTILYANDFVKRLGQVDTSNAAILIASNARVYDKETGLLLPGELINIVNKGGYGPNIGSYPITLSVASDPAARTTIVGKVITGKSPVLTVDPVFVEVSLNGMFDPGTGVSALDEEDGMLGVATEGTVNTSVAGVYPLIYTVIDSDFNTVTKTRVVVVKDASFTTGNSTILQANDFTKRVGQVNTSVAAIKAAAGVTVYDKATGQVLPNEAVNLVSAGGYEPVVGTYPITLQVASDGLATRTISASVITGELPVLTVDPAFMEVPLNGTVNKKMGVTATDTEDGVLTEEVQITGSVDTSIAGVYTLTYTVTDSDQNAVSLTRVILVNDGQGNAGDNFLMTGKAFTKRLSEVDLTESAIKQAAQVRVYDKVTGIETFGNTIIITDLGGYQGVPGDYNITFGLAEDASVQLTLVATVLTDTPPQLTVPKFTEIGRNGTFNPKKGVSAIDVEDGDITDFIKVQGKVDVTKAGIYLITYEITDSDYNKVTAVQTVLVNDGSLNYANGYIIQGNDFKIGLSKANLSDAELIALANIRVFDVENQIWINNPMIRVDRGNFGAQVGTYKITFLFNPDITVNVTVFQDGTTTGPDKAPQSGDESKSRGFVLWFIIAGVTLVGLSRRKLNKKSK